MFALLALLAAAPAAAPDDRLASQFRAAIWYDLQVNAMIGNGNWPGSLWYQGGSDGPNPPLLHIQDLACRARSGSYRCTFNLFREGGVVAVHGDDAPDRLACGAIFVRSKDGSGWHVKHTPPRGGGHSWTTMRCKAVPA